VEAEARADNNKTIIADREEQRLLWLRADLFCRI
jgi:hypothetical protein